MGLLNKDDKAHIRRGAWYKTVNNPIPDHVKEAAAMKNPLHGAEVISNKPNLDAVTKPEVECNRNKPGRY